VLPIQGRGVAAENGCMSRRPSRLAACTPLAVMVLTLTACGSSEPPATAAAPTTAEPAVAEATPQAPARPTIAEPTVAPLQIDDSVFNLYGSQEMVETAYGEVIELATDLAFNPDYFFRDGNNSSADLAPVLERLVPEQAEFLRGKADACVNSDSDACGSVIGIVFFDFGTDEQRYTYRDDLEFVTQQSVTNPKAVGVVPDLGTSYLEVSFDHTSTVRFMISSTPAVVTMTRHLTFNLDPTPGASTRWRISNWHMDYNGDLRNEATGEPIEG
jgi:hypothetical protein